MRFKLYPPTPYSLAQEIRWLWRNIIPGRNNPGNIKYIPNEVVLSDFPVLCLAGFVGDIMPAGDSELSFSENVTDFFHDCDFICGNFEGIIAGRNSRRGLLRHNRRIVMDLSRLKHPEKFCLSLANNHQGDFGEREFLNSVDILRSEGFRLFGFRSSPCAEIKGIIRLSGYTRWRNTPENHTLGYHDIISTGLTADMFNIVMPHWGYELELYPGMELIRTGKSLLSEFDAVIGNHSHIPQPVILVQKPGGTTSVVAFSLGNFCYSSRLKKYCFGIILKIGIGRNKCGMLHITGLNWSFIKTIRKSGTLRIDTTEYLPYI